MIDFKEYAVITDNEINGFQIIRIIKGSFSDIEFTYGKVEIVEDKDAYTANIKFEYDIQHGLIAEDALDEFKVLLGHLLVAIIQSQLEHNEIVYSGGIDGE